MLLSTPCGGTSCVQNSLHLAAPSSLLNFCSSLISTADKSSLLSYLDFRNDTRLCPGNFARTESSIFPTPSSFVNIGSAGGNSIKVVTGSTGLQTGKVTPEQPVYPVERSYTPPGTTRPINNFGGSSTTEYGPLLATVFPVAGPTTVVRYDNFNSGTMPNPCRVR